MYMYTVKTREKFRTSLLSFIDSPLGELVQYKRPCCIGYIQTRFEKSCVYIYIYMIACVYNFRVCNFTHCKLFLYNLEWHTVDYQLLAVNALKWPQIEHLIGTPTRRSSLRRWNILMLEFHHEEHMNMLKYSHVFNWTASGATRFLGAREGSR